MGAGKKLVVAGLVGAGGVGGIWALSHESAPPAQNRIVKTFTTPDGSDHTLTFNRDGAHATFVVDTTPSLGLTLDCNPTNSAQAKIATTILGREVARDFTMGPGDTMTAPCLKGVVNPEYDKIADGAFKEIVQTAIRNKVLGEIGSRLPGWS